MIEQLYYHLLNEIENSKSSNAIANEKYFNHFKENLRDLCLGNRFFNLLRFFQDDKSYLMKFNSKIWNTKNLHNTAIIC